MAQFHVYPNPGTKKVEIPYLVVVQNDHITSRTGATVVIPLRADAHPVEIMAPLVEVPGQGQIGRAPYEYPSFSEKLSNE